MGSFGQERRKRICLRLQMRDLWIFGVTRSIWFTVPGIQMNLFETGMENHLNDADFFQLVSNSRQVGVWKDDITGCRWVLFGLWWISSPYVVMVRIYKVLAFNRLFWSSTRYLGNFGEICSSRMSKQENVITIDLVTPTFCHVFLEIQAGTIFAKEFGLRNLAGKKFQWLSSLPFCFKNFAMKIVELFEFWVMLYHLWWCWKNGWDASGSFSNAMRNFVLFARKFIWAWVLLFVLETNRKQTTCTNKFSMCLPRDQFLV